MKLRRRFYRVPKDVFDDAVGDAIVAWLERDEIPSDPYERQLLFWTICRGCIARNVRKWSKQGEDIDILPQQPSQPEKIVLLREVLDALEKCPITHRTRQALLLSAFGESIRDIALSLNITIANVKKKLYRGRMSVARILGINR